MADIELLIKIPEDEYNIAKYGQYGNINVDIVRKAIANGTPLTPDVLADLLMEERIRGELKQNICYSRDIVDNVECNLTVEIIDRRPCHCGAEMESEEWI